MRLIFRLFLIATFLLTVPLAAATEGTKKVDSRDGNKAPETKKTSKAARARARKLNRITVLGAPGRASGIPGSVDRIGSKQLDGINQAFDDIHRVLLRIPGVTVSEEEGYGLRPNIGMRATGTDRSANITLMEDGVLAAPAPYAAPAAYYFPVTGRMESIEVRKGSSQIKYGPRTNGGALNLISTAVRDDFGLRIRSSVGANSMRKLHANVGDAWKNVAWLAEGYRTATDGFKELDTGGSTGYEVRDFVGKVRVSSSADASHYNELTFKAGYKDETSHETYLGLTDDDFAANPYRRYAASQADVMNNEHRQLQARHFVMANDNVDVTTTIYHNSFKRNWYKLDKVAGTSISDVLAEPDMFPTEFAYLRGDSASPDDALSVKANNRKYFSQGLESIIGISVNTAGWQNEMEIGLRIHRDEEDRFQYSDGYRIGTNLDMTLTTRGKPGEAGGGNNRVNSAEAIAAFWQDNITRGRWTVVPGVRFENIRMKKEQYRPGDAARDLAPTTTETTTNVFVPGIGASYRATGTINAFAGVHRGFAPPGPGADEETLPEESVNYEVGVRINRHRTRASALVFFNQYDNLLGRDSFSGGGTGSGDLFNAGEVQARGVEASLEVLTTAGGIDFPVTAAYTYSAAEFRTSFDSDFGPWGSVTAGDRVPYIPSHQFSLSVGVEGRRWSANVFGSYTSRVRTQAGQGDIPDNESVDARFLVDVTSEVVVGGGVRVFVSLQNISDEAYIVARRPAGVRPGLPRTFVAGLKFDM